MRGVGHACSVCEEKLDKYSTNDKAKESASQSLVTHACTAQGTQRVSLPPFSGCRRSTRSSSSSKAIR